jgi:hypothetical protein
MMKETGDIKKAPTAFTRALRETETETETDRFSIKRKPAEGWFSKILVFGFPNNRRVFFAQFFLS